MDLYFSPRCGNSKRVLFAIGELGIDVATHPVDLSRGEQRAPAYLAINPMGKVPALVDGDLVLWESNAIALYLAEQRPERGLVPAPAGARAELYKWLFFLAYEVSQPAYRFFSSKDPAERDAAAEPLRTVFPILERQLADRDHLLGAFSLADIAYAPSMWILKVARFDLSAWPRVAQWAARVHDRPAWRALV
jgi:glutathione S-transferase